MTVSFEPDSGQLTLDRVSFDALLALAAGTGPTQRGLEKTREAGLVDGSSIHPALRTPFAAAADPIAVGRLEMRNENNSQVVVEFWVSTDAATYLIGQPGGELRLVSTPPDFFPVSVARLVGLSPRPTTSFQPWRMPPHLVHDLFGDDADRRATAAGTITATIDDAPTTSYADGLARGPWWYWTLSVRWPNTPGSDGERSLHVVDSQQGMAIMSLSDDLIAVDPTGPSEVFRLLTVILPGDEEVAFTPAPTA